MGTVKLKCWWVAVEFCWSTPACKSNPTEVVWKGHAPVRTSRQCSQRDRISTWIGTVAWNYRNSVVLVIMFVLFLSQMLHVYIYIPSLSDVWGKYKYSILWPWFQFTDHMPTCDASGAEPPPAALPEAVQEIPTRRKWTDIYVTKSQFFMNFGVGKIYHANIYIYIHNIIQKLICIYIL